MDAGMIQWQWQDFVLAPSAVLGQGRYANALIDACGRENALRTPMLVDPMRPERAPELPRHLIVGTDTFQAQIVARWRPYLRSDQVFVDVSNLVLPVISGIPDRAPETPARGDVLFCGVGTAISESRWLLNLRRAFEDLGWTWGRVHPLANDLEQALSGARAVILWNGSSELFSGVQRSCHRLGIPVTYAECGFFPQSDYFFLDKNGVNLDSQLADDTLEWLAADDWERLEQRREALFGGHSVADGGYVFVPLQIASDSNVQRHSRFRNGMQQYIDHIVREYLNERVIFKPHPKDPGGNQYDFHGREVSEASSLELVAGASRVRGINSSVLFEAALCGKPITMDGESLLSARASTAKAMLAAMIARQQHVDERELCPPRLMRFSNLSHLL